MAEKDALPFVSIVMPVRNERDFIARAVGCVLEQDYPPERMEILVSDGCSDDGTREILAAIERHEPRLQVLENAGRIASTGLNAAIARARGEIVIRIDGHSEIGRDFVRTNVRLLESHAECWSTGGPIVHAGRSRFGRAAAVAMSHPFGVANARDRFAGFHGYADGAQFPAYRRWVFDRVGTFDEGLVRNQDDELNYRIRRAGGKILVSPEVRYTYYVRDRIGQLFRQYFQHGYWNTAVIRKHRRPTPLRRLVPLTFYLASLVLLIAGLASARPDLILALPAAYGIALLIAGASALGRTGWLVAPLVPAAMATMHAGYALGTAYGLCAFLRDRNAWDRDRRVTGLSR
jgi:succinoglycan biosynthesis protein ExoA